MIACLIKPDNRIVLLIRAEGAGALGDAQAEVRPGTTVFGRTHAEWSALPEGSYEINDPPAWKPLRRTD